MARTEPDDRQGQTRELLAAIGEERTWLVLRALIRQPRTATELEQATALDQPRVSRAVGTLRAAGLIDAATGRGMPLRVPLRQEVLELVRAGDRLSEAVNARRVEDQRHASRQTSKDLLAGERPAGGGRDERARPADD